MASEYLATNILEDGFMKSFAPILFVQKMCCSGRTNFQYRFATGPSKGQRLLTVIVLILIISLYNYSRFTYVLNYEDALMNDTFLFALNQAQTSIYMLGVLAHLVQVRFFDYNKASEFYMKLQEIGYTMKMRHSKTRLYKMVYHRSVAYICVVCVFDFLFVYGSMWYNYNLTLMISCISWATVIFLLELALCVQTGLVLIAKLKYLNGILKSEFKPMEKMCEHRVQKYWWYPRDCLMEHLVVEDGRTLSSSDVTLYLREIFKGYKMFGDVFKFQIFILFTSTLMWTMLSIEVIILGKNRLEVFYLMSCATGIVIDFVFISAIGLLGGSFQREVKSTKYICTKILTLYSEGPTRKKVKTLIRMIENNTPVFSIYGIWTVDYGIIMKLFSITTTYLVILLQLSYL